MKAIHKAWLRGVYSPRFNVEGSLRILLKSSSTYDSYFNRHKGTPISHTLATIHAHLLPRATPIHDARDLQAQCGGPVACFRKHSFALLRKATKVKEWNDEISVKKSEITEVYHKEVEEMIHQLYPQDGGPQINHVNQYWSVIRRGPGAKKNLYSGFYSTGVHSDYGYGKQDYLQ